MTDEREPLRAQPGPQQALLSSAVDIAVYGGAAGGGKSFALLLEASRLATVPNSHGVIFRRNSTQLMGAGSIWEEACAIFSRIPGAKSRQSPQLEWRFPNGSILEFRHMQYESDRIAYQGKQYAFVGFDEATHFTEAQVWYLVSRMRSTSGLRPVMRLTCNPDPDSFIRKLIDWYIDKDTGLAIHERAGATRWMIRDGDQLHWGNSRRELREAHPHLVQQALSFTFIPSMLSDNPALVKADPDYAARLQLMPRVERERLLGANWNVRAVAGSYFRRSWFEVLDQLPPGEPIMTVRAWDKASTEPHEGNKDPDWSRGVKASLWPGRIIVIEHIEGLRATPGRVERAIVNCAKQDGHGCKVLLWQDPGQAGVGDVEHLTTALFGYWVISERAARDKEAYAGPVSAQAEHGHIKLLRGSWNEEFLSEAEAFPTKGRHDDMIDALSRAFIELAGGASVEAQWSALASA